MPKENKRRRVTGKSASTLASPTLADTLRLLMLGFGTKPVPDQAGLCAILDGIRQVLVPMVSSMDKPLGEFESFFKSEHLTPELRKMRVMPVFNGYTAGLLMSVALNRAGDWFVDLLREKEKPRKVEANGLSALVLHVIDGYLPDYLGRVMLPGCQNPGEGAEFLKDLFRYAAIVRFVRGCSKTVMDVIEEKERLIRMLRERAGLIGQFADALDPLRSGRKRAELPLYSIFEEHDHGSRRETGDYLSAGMLAPFLELIQQRFPVKRYRVLRDSSRRLESLDELGDCLRWIFSEIEDAQKRAPKEGVSAETLSLPFASGRLPLGQEELEITQRLVASLA
jgi:hypothetical protein